MNYTEILSSKASNLHYLIRYIKFIKYCYSTNINCTDKTIKYVKHHICPKAKDLFPEYSNFSVNPWNKIKVTQRQHLICHWMLSKVFEQFSQKYAFSMLISKAQESGKYRIFLSKMKSIHKINLCNRKNFGIGGLKWVYNTVTHKHHRFPQMDQLPDDYIYMAPVKPKKEPYIKKYHDIHNDNEYWVDTRYPIPSTLTIGRSKKFISQVTMTSKGNKANKGLKRYYNLITSEVFFLKEGDAKILELNLTRGVPQNIKNKLKAAKIKNGSWVGSKNPNYGKKSANRKTCTLILPNEQVLKFTSILEFNSWCKVNGTNIPRKFWNIGVVVTDNITYLKLNGMQIIIE